MREVLAHPDAGLRLRRLPPLGLLWLPRLRWLPLVSALLNAGDGERLAAALESMRLSPGDRARAQAWIPIVRFGAWSTAPPWLVAADVALLHRAAVDAQLPQLVAVFTARS